MLLVAVSVAVAAALAGVWLAWHLDSAPAPTIVLLLSAAFVAAFPPSSRRQRAAERVARGARDS